jgi:hypothetical protein
MRRHGTETIYSRELGDRSRQIRAIGWRRIHDQRLSDLPNDARASGGEILDC